jgi:hypothetical protein
MARRTAGETGTPDPSLAHRRAGFGIFIKMPSSSGILYEEHASNLARKMENGTAKSSGFGKREPGNRRFRNFTAGC